MAQSYIAHYVDASQALRKDKVPGIFSGKFSLSPYTACAHGCTYCDGRHERYNVTGDFEKDITVRKNIITLLEEELPKVREKGYISVGSGITDAYQPVEETEQLSRRCLKLLAAADHPVSLITKSSRLLRDIDLCDAINKKNGFVLMISLMLLDDTKRAIFEPNASSVEERLHVIREFKQRGIAVGVLAMPFIPFITDSTDDVVSLYHSLKELNVDFVWPGLMTLKAGRQKELFLNVVHSHYPEKTAQIAALYDNDDIYGIPRSEHTRRKYKEIHELLFSMTMPMRPPMDLTKDRFQLYDEVQIIMQDMADMYSMRGTDIRPLVSSLKRYKDWLKEAKAPIARRRTMSYDELDIRLKTMIAEGSINDILKNEKLSVFLRSIFIEGKTFDYVTCRIR